MTNFKLVSNMNVAFHNSFGDPYLFDEMPVKKHEVIPAQLALDFPGISVVLEASDKAWSKLENQCKNILAEYNELMKAIDERNIDAVRDGLCDIHVFAYGAHHFIGYDADADMKEVVDAVMTRFCRDDNIYQQTAMFYANKGVEFYVEGEFPKVCLKSARDQQMPEYPKGKFLKALDYRQPDFYQLPAKSLRELIERYTAPKPATAAPAPKFDDVTEVMAKERQAVRDELKRKQALINKQVEEYRGKLEQEAYGLTPYDSAKGI